MSYNVENLFDTVDNPDRADDDFTPGGRYRWTKKILSMKFKHLGEVVKSIKNRGRAPCPDILALTEVENGTVLQSWKRSALKECGYKRIIIDKVSSDMRGIQNAIMTRLDVAGRPISHKTYPGGRNILEVPFMVNGHIVVVFVNHWKSRSSFFDKDGGKKKRSFAAKLLRKRILELLEEYPDLDILVTGDLNDESEDASLKKDLKVTASVQAVIDYPERGLFWETSFNILSLPAFQEIPAGKKRDDYFKMARATYYYSTDKSYTQLDHILINHALFDGYAFDYVPHSFRVVRHPKYVDPKTMGPLRFRRFFQDGVDIGPKGASDHFPVLVRLRVER